MYIVIGPVVRVISLLLDSRKS